MQEVFYFINKLILQDESKLITVFIELLKDDDSVELSENNSFNNARDKLIELIKNEFVVFRPNTNKVAHNGFNLFDGKIAINWDAIHHENINVLKSRFLVIYLHELAHAARYIYAIDKKIMKRTPARLKGESGYYLEKELFGICISQNISCIDAKISEKILNINSYKSNKFLKKCSYTYTRYIEFSYYKTMRSCVHDKIKVTPSCRPYIRHHT